MSLPSSGLKNKPSMKQVASRAIHLFKAWVYVEKQEGTATQFISSR
jgi:hypothetical protein